MQQSVQKVEKGWKGRGALSNPSNRFESLKLEWEEEYQTGQGVRKTLFYEDPTSEILSYNKSPDLGFELSLNPYRGCEHGCIYCYARPTHEYLGFSAGVDFESRILVKTKAPFLLEKVFRSPRWKSKLILVSGVTDCYQPCESHFKLTRQCLEIFLKYRQPLALITKNRLVCRDMDLLKELARHNLVNVSLSVTTLDPALASVLEPRASKPQSRLEAIRALSSEGIPVGVMFAPVIPGLNDFEMPSILKAASEAGASFAGYSLLRLPWSVADLFVEWLSAHFPGKKEKILNRIRDFREGKLSDSRFGTRMTGSGKAAAEFNQWFGCFLRKYGYGEKKKPGINSPLNQQLELFE
ncbi:PA0069 family radical SAM protein [Candidatus Methylacidiphilum infernorum]|uniref:PA0069 family radical SAM protein n=1 Tax=Candidatus Methylacidiphilum infernorum TaxID=511746 RepID=A0ABX7PXA4_9BACT|nr:PA0069 family radical SAM protein [Candidatus Methylacidiphilum infernorum]QSR87460.1 PA0069 family radical SAM protein [Candidatus Methylacidiphilum infernorum]